MSFLSSLGLNGFLKLSKQQTSRLGRRRLSKCRKCRAYDPAELHNLPGWTASRLMAGDTHSNAVVERQNSYLLGTLRSPREAYTYLGEAASLLCQGSSKQSCRALQNLA